MRLQKYMAQAQVASRRKSEEIISQGRVTVNGKVISEMGYVVKEGDIVKVDGKRINLVKNFVYYLLNKPIGVVCTTNDEKNRVNVVDLIETTRRIYPVGRLDIDTTGLVFLTDDGEIASKIIHPRNKIPKKYIATVEGTPSGVGLNKLRRGIMLDGRRTAPAKVRILKNYNTDSIVEIIITEGRNHQVKNMFNYIGNPVKKLKRIGIGELSLGLLQPGEYRELEEFEVEYLRKL